MLCLDSLVPLALKAISLGADPSKISTYLSWRDFEALVMNYLREFGMDVLKNIYFGKRRFEVDVIGVDYVSGISLVIDCKHWMPGYSKVSRLRRAARDHRVRTIEFSKNCIYMSGIIKRIFSIKYFIPVIVTLTDSVKGVVNNVAIVPIRYLNDFIRNLEYYVDLLGRDKLLIRNECFMVRKST